MISFVVSICFHPCLRQHLWNLQPLAPTLAAELTGTEGKTFSLQSQRDRLSPRTEVNPSFNHGCTFDKRHPVCWVARQNHDGLLPAIGLDDISTPPHLQQLKQSTPIKIEHTRDFKSFTSWSESACSLPSLSLTMLPHLRARCQGSTFCTHRMHPKPSTDESQHLN